MSRRTYRDEEYWRRYQRFFPEPMRCTDERAPVEHWWPWRAGQIHLDRFEAPDARLKILLLHGGGGHGRLLAPIGVMLRSAGYACVAPDLPGYGLSEVDAADFDYASWVDVASELLLAERQRDGIPVVLFGLSLGGMLAYQVAARTRAAAGVIATTLADARTRLVREQFARTAILGRFGIPVLQASASLFGNIRVPIRWLSRMHAIANDPELSAVVNRDPLGGGNRTPLRFMASLMDMAPDIEPEAFDLCPVLLAHPAADRWTTFEASQPFFDRLAAEKTLVMLDNCGHIPIEAPGCNQLETAVADFLAALK